MDALRTLVEMFPGSLAAGLLSAMLCSALGVFVILKRVVFIGIALSEAATCGIALALVLGISPFAGAATLTMAVGLGLSRPYENGRIPRDAVLGILFVGAAACGLLVASHAALGVEEIKALLYGDLILAQPADLRTMGLVMVPISVCGWRFRHHLLYAFLDREAAGVLGVRVALWETLFFLALALAVAASARAAGTLLVFAYLVVSPAAALLISRRIARVLAVAMGLSAACTLAGLHIALVADLPANQLIAALLVGAFLLVACGVRLRGFWVDGGGSRL